MLRIILLAIAHFQNSPMKISISIGETIFWKNVCLEWIFTCCCSVTKSCPALCNTMDCSTPGFPVLHYLWELAQIHVQWVDDAIYPSHPLLLSSPLPSVFPRIRVFSNESALHIRWPKYWSFSFSISPVKDWLPLGLTGLISLLSKGLSRVFSSITIQKHQFFNTQTSLWSNSHIHTWLVEKS